MNNYIIGQKQVFGRVPATRISTYLYSGYSANRHKDGVNFSLGLVTEQEKLLWLMLREKVKNPREGKDREYQCSRASGGWSVVALKLL